jgi:ubiquinone/menaquinone biosynthesis C-methylase UbiE
VDKSIAKDQLLLPGGNKQFEHFLSKKFPAGENALVIGSGCEKFASELLLSYKNVAIIVNDYDSLLHSKLLVNDNIFKVRMMDYSHTDFNSEFFDFVYAQASLSIPNKKNIVKELRRILKNDGILCTGEIISLKQPVPAFVKDIWEQGGLEPPASSEIQNYFTGKGFEIISEEDLSFTLRDFYEKIRYKVSKTGKEDKMLNKKLFTRMKHEANVYLKLGGDKYIGFKSLIMRKVN